MLLALMELILIEKTDKYEYSINYGESSCRVSPGSHHSLGLKCIYLSGDQNFIVKMGEREFILPKVAFILTMH